MHNTNETDEQKTRLLQAQRMRLMCLWLTGLVLFVLTAKPWNRPVDSWPASGPAALFDRVDVERDPWTSIARLNGIGRSLSIQIIDYRSRNSGNGGPCFGCPEDMQRVKGVGPAKTDRIRADLYFGPALFPETHDVINNHDRTTRELKRYE